LSTSIRPARSLQVSGGGADGGGGLGGVQPETSWPLHLLLPGSGPWHSRATPDAASFQVKKDEQLPGSANFLQLFFGISVRPARSLQVRTGMMPWQKSSPSGAVNGMSCPDSSGRWQ